MILHPARRATLDDLYRVEGKAELIGGRIVRFMASGLLPSEVALEIALSLRAYAKKSGRGVALGDGIGYAVPELPSGRPRVVFAGRLVLRRPAPRQPDAVH